MPRQQPKYAKVKLNHFRMTSMVNDVVSDGLRVIFKQEWNNRYQATLGEWVNTLASGQIFYSKEKARSSARQNLPKFKNGNVKEWDCSVLFDAILYSNSIGKSRLNPIIKREVDSLRKVRNFVCHVPRVELSNTEFQNQSRKVLSAFQALGLSTVKIDEFREEKTFSTAELYTAKVQNGILTCLFFVSVIVSAVFYTLNGTTYVSSFQFLPSQPSHEIINRTDTVSNIIQTLRKLNDRNNRKLSYFYISGNPGSGKSQLARQIGERHHTEIIKQNVATFVMTLSGKSTNSLLESYEDFARRLNCGESSLLSIINSTKTTKEKIRRLMTVIAKEINKYYSWLIIVDDVENLMRVSSLLPQRNDAYLNGGQVLITTQDSSHIPPNNSFTAHVSVSPGMRESESIHLLTTLSGTSDDPMLNEVAKTLDYQPLALAAAGVYLKQVRETKVSPEFSWRNYMKKLDEDKRQLTEELLRDINPNYSRTMTTAVLLAVEKVAQTDIVMNHTFHFLSIASHTSLPLEVVINYILEVDKRLDKEQVGFKIRKCSLIIPQDYDVVSIRIHRVVHDAIRVYSRKSETEMQMRLVAAAKSFFKFRCKNYSMDLIPHLKAFHSAMTRTFPDKNTWNLLNGDSQMLKMFSNFANMLQRYGEFLISIDFLTAVQGILENLKDRDNNRGLNNAKYYNHELSKIFSDLAIAFGEIGLPLKAKNYLESARDTLLELYGDSHIDLAVVFENLGGVHLDLEEIKKAKRYFEMSLDIRVERLGYDHVNVANSYANLGRVCVSLGELEQAKLHLARAVEIFWKQSDSFVSVDIILKVATCMTNLGAVHYHNGDMDKAKWCQKLALDERLRYLGSNHVRVAEIYFNMGLIYDKLNDLNEAKKYYEKALNIFKQQRGNYNAKLAPIYNNLENIHHDMGKLDVAKQYYNLPSNLNPKNFVQ